MNCRGLGQFRKRRDVFHFLKNTGADIFLLQDIHCSEKKRTLFRNCWGRDIFISSGTNNGRGVSVLPSKNIQLDVLKENHDETGNIVLVKAVINKTFEVLLMPIYGPNEDNPLFFQELAKMIGEITENDESLPIIMCGDLNIALDQKVDTYNYDNVNNARGKRELKRLMKTHELKDSFRELNPGSIRYTWRRCNPSIKQARLDYILVSSSIFGSVQKAYILPVYRTDHAAVCLDLVVTEQQRGK